MIYLILTTWYIIGFTSCMYTSRRIEGKSTRLHLIVSLTAGGLCGFISLICGLPYWFTKEWFNKKIF